MTHDVVNSNSSNSSNSLLPVHMNDNAGIETSDRSSFESTNGMAMVQETTIDFLRSFEALKEKSDEQLNGLLGTLKNNWIKTSGDLANVTRSSLHGKIPALAKWIRDSQTDTEITEGGCIDLAIRKQTILTPTKNDTVRYYGRLGMDKLFDQLVLDPPEKEQYYNLALIGHPGAGKSNLVWAAADYLASSLAKTVLWVGHRLPGQDWKVKSLARMKPWFFLYEVTNCPKLLSTILDLGMFKHVDVLVLDAPIKKGSAVSGADGIAAFNWAGNDERIENRRVIHVSSLGSFVDKQTDRLSIGLKEIPVRPWTRDDFVKATTDKKLKLQVCKTLGIDPETIDPDQLVDRKFYYSGINARWFFNSDVDTIMSECKDILSRLSGDSTQSGDKHKQAVNSAILDFWVDSRQTKLFTSSYLAFLIGSNQGQQQMFFSSFPLMRERLGNGSPGEIFECDFAMHLQHSHDLADAQRAIMGEDAPAVDVLLGTVNGEMVRWPTGALHGLPKAPSDKTSFQRLPFNANKLRARDPLWFIPEDPSQPFLDFFVLVPSEKNATKWTFRPVQNTESPKHTTDEEQLARLLGGVLLAGFNLENDIQVAFVIENAAVQNDVAKSFDGAEVDVNISSSGTRRAGGQALTTFKVTVLRPVYARTGATPS